MEAPYEFEVETYEDQEKIEKVHGVLFANSYGEAADKLASYFQGELKTMRIFENEESPVYIFEDTQEELWHGLYEVDFKEWVTK